MAAEGAAMTTLPEPDIIEWINSPALTLAGLRGKVVVLHAFQMLCPGCVSRSLPQMQQLHAMRLPDLAVVGLHTVFEHHEAMPPVALRAFLSEYRLTFPVAIDRPRADGPLPETMRAWGLEGTPTTLLLDRAGRLRHHHLGAEADLLLGLRIGALLAETPDPAPQAAPEPGAEPACRPGAPC